nr:integrase, catalytic region, zinc finger, CCHC-type, peptidase aspartic, catalytic [Tanacetum cinerariifolium]
MNYLEEQTDGEAMINSIKNGDQPLPVIAQINETAKDLWDALERQMHGSEYGEQDRKATILYEYETNLLDINIDALYNILKQNQGDVNDALGYKKKAVVITLDQLALVAEKTKITALLAKAFNQRKFYSKPANNNLRTSYTSQSADKKQEFVKSDDKKVEMKDDEKKRDMSKVKCYNCKKEGHFAKDHKKAKVKDYNYYKTKMLLAKKDSDEQVLHADDQAWMESSSDSNQEINSNIVFMAQIEKVLLDSDESSSSAEETIAEVAYYTSESESKSKYKTSKYYDNSTNYGLFVNNDDDQEILHDATKSASENFIENDIDSQKHYDKDRFWKSKLFEKAKDLRPSLYDEKVIGLEYTLVFLIPSNEALEIKKFKRARENKIEFAYDYGNLNASYQKSSLKPYVPTVILEKIIIDLEDEVMSLLEKEKANLKTIESLKSKDLDTISSVRRPKQSSVIWKKKGSSNTSNADLSYIVQIYLWIIDLGCSKHMTGNRALLTNFVEMFFGTVRFGNNDFAVIVVYGDVVIGSMTIKKVHYVKGLGHNLFSVGQFCDKGLRVAFRKSTCFVRNEDGVDLLIGDRSSNLYTIALNEVASNSLTCLLAKDSSSQSWL